MSCSKEEIERKRLAALQKRKSKLLINLPSTKENKVESYQRSPGVSNLIKPSTYAKSRSDHNHKHYHPYQKPEVKVDVPIISKIISGTTYLISEEKFEVNPSEFCAPLISIFKTIPSKSYDANTRLWSFLIEDYELLMSKVLPLAPHVVLGSIPPYILKLLREPCVDPSSIDISPIEATLRNKLMPFQEDGVRFGIAKRGRCMIADDMGLGKTFQALAIASYYRRDWPLLIVTTSSMRETWQSKIHELLPSIPLLSVVSITSGKDVSMAAESHAEIVIISYKIVSMHTESLKEKRFKAVIIDESHYLKSPKAQCTVALTAITRQATRVILLSGTPALSRPVELYSQLSIIQPNFFNGYTEYGKRYCAGKMTNFGWDMSGQSNLIELQVMLQRRFLIRRTKDQVYTGLQDKTRETVSLDKTLLEFSQEDKKGLTQMAQRYMDTKATDKQAALLAFFSESARVKIPAICKYLKQLTREESGKFLVFAHHINMIEAICGTLDDLSVPYVCIVGATPANTRADLVDTFQYNESCRCAVLSITAASAGITLTAASLVLFAELHWNPGILSQAESRAHRLGQRGTVCARYLLAPGTVDDHMWPLLAKKLAVLNEAGLSKDSYEDTTHTVQKSSNNISQYLSQCSPRNRSDYIDGTNIRKGTLSTINKDPSSTIDKNNDSLGGTELEASFFDDFEDDELLAGLDI